jgi:hypothetical protein
VKNTAVAADRRVRERFPLLAQAILADGRLDALIHTGVVAMTPHNSMPEPFVLPAKSVYASKTFFLDVETVKMNMVANTFMRAPGEALGTFGLESAMDELAVELGLDPIELRIRNEPEKDPLTGLPFSQRGIVSAMIARSVPVQPFFRSPASARLRDNFLSKFSLSRSSRTRRVALQSLPGYVSRPVCDAQRAFRCVEPIIRFSMQFYNEPLVPLHVPRGVERLDPPLVDIFVEDGERRGPNLVCPPAIRFVEDRTFVVRPYNSWLSY